MEYKKINYNNEQYNILTSIKIGTTTFMICMDLFDNKLIYFKQEVIDGKVKLTTSANMVTTASDINKKSLSNKKRILDAFCKKIEEQLVASVFVDKDKVVSLFKQFTRDIDACDLKYYIIDNASIEPNDESIQRMVDKYSDANVTKDLEKNNLAQNELYYFGDIEEKKEEPKEEAIDNSNKLEIGTNNFAKIEKSESDNSIDNMQGNLASEDHLFDNVDEMMKNTVVNIPKQEEAPVVEISPEEMKRKKKKNRITIAVTLVLLIAFLGGYFIFFNKEKVVKTNGSIVDRLLEIAELKESENGIPYNKPAKTTENYLYYMDQNLIDIDISKLEEENEDIVAWIKMDSLGINYPIVKSENDFYSNHDFDKKSSNDGWIYVEDNSFKEEFAYNTVIYGAKASDNSLFGRLADTLSDEWLKDYKNYYFNISSKHSNTMWQIASAYEIPKDELNIKVEFDDEDDFLKYYSSIVKKGSNLFSVIPNEDDKLITLVSDKDDNTKIVVVAKLIKIEEKEQPKEEELDSEDDNELTNEETSAEEDNEATNEKSTNDKEENDKINLETKDKNENEEKGE